MVAAKRGCNCSPIGPSKTNIRGSWIAYHDDAVGITEGLCKLVVILIVLFILIHSSIIVTLFVFLGMFTGTGSIYVVYRCCMYPSVCPLELTKAKHKFTSLLFAVLLKILAAYFNRCRLRLCQANL